ncbi:TMV resistance protein N-like protein [Tanacetum coccineum]
MEIIEDLCISIYICFYIITTRNQHLLSDAYATYKPNILLLDQAVELFCRHAIKTNIPPDDYKELSYRAVCYAGYLPLALKFLGSFFYGRHILLWESSLNRLAKEPNIEIFKTLKLSYDGLHLSEKKIFLDIACFFKCKDKEHVNRILDSFGFDPVIGISVLIEKSLITVSKKRLEMHYLIQEMGWQIVCDIFTNSRIWELEEMHNRIIQNTVNPEFLSHEPTVLPDELRWLCWHKYPFIALPVARMRTLVGLEMVSSAIKCLWMGRKILPRLKFINLSESQHITRIPNASGSQYIERFILANCMVWRGHQLLACHRRLVYLDMSGCWRLKYLPSTMEMQSLETLILSNCSSLKRFLEVSPYGDKLKRKYEEKNFPPNLHAFSSLEELNLSGNSELTQLPTGISKLSNLKILELNECSRLQVLDNLPSRIQMLKASGCRSLESIGNFTEDYEWLYKIWLFGCHKLLQKQENKRYIDRMLELSFIKKCAALNHRLTIGIPGNHVPIWFKEYWNGCNAVLKLPPRCHGKIMGFVICGVFHREWHLQYAFPRIIFKIVNKEKVIPMPEVNWSNASAVADNGTQSVRCGAHIVYKEDMESVQESKAWISDYGNLLQVGGDDYQKHPDYDTIVSGNTYVYEEKPDEEKLNPTHLRTRMRSRNIMDRTLSVDGLFAL